MFPKACLPFSFWLIQTEKKLSEELKKEPGQAEYWCLDCSYDRIRMPKKYNTKEHDREPRKLLQWKRHHKNYPIEQGRIPMIRLVRSIYLHHITKSAVDQWGKGKTAVLFSNFDKKLMYPYFDYHNNKLYFTSIKFKYWLVCDYM